MTTVIASSPYPGLRAFEVHEADLFFGRDEQSDELLRRLQMHRFLAVVGTSGCGKSSLVRAGLLPSLFGGGMMTAGSAWRVATMKPGANPIGNLAAALNAPDVFGKPGRADEPLPASAFTEAALRRGPLGLVDVVRQFRPSRTENLLVLVDQFEEIFRFAPLTAPRQQDDAAAFVKLLLEAASQPELPIYIVLTMRSDFIGECARFRGLPEAINEGQYLVPRMTRSQLREAIEGPAAVGGAKVSAPLVQVLLAEVGDDPDRLPLLQHALMRSWTLRSAPETLDLTAYEATGGIEEALSRHADEAYLELTEPQREIARKLFQRLTEIRGPGAGIRRPTRLQEVCEVVDAPLDEVVPVVEAFRRPDRSFLMPPQPVPLTPESTLDISHESLMRQWRRLAEWTRKEHESAEQYRRLSEATALHAAGRAGLWRSPELDLALSWKQSERPSAAWAARYNAEYSQVMAFLETSRGRQRRQRVGAIAALAVASAAAIALVWVVSQVGFERRLRIRVAAGLTDPLQRALVLAELGAAARPEHLQLFEQAASAFIPVAVVGAAGTDRQLTSVAFSADGKTLFTLSDDGRLGVSNADGRGGVTSVEIGPNGADAGPDPGSLELTALSRRGDWAAAFSGGAIYVGRIDALGRVESTSSISAASTPAVLALSDDGRRLAAGFSDGSVQVWSRQESGALAVAAARTLGEAPVSVLTLDSAGDRIAAGLSWSGEVHIWRVIGSEPPVVIPALPDQPTPEPESLAFSADGGWLLSGYSDGVARLWNTGALARPLELRGHDKPLKAVAIGPGTFGNAGVPVVTAAEDAIALLWDVRQAPGDGTRAENAPPLVVNGAPVRLAGHLEALNAVAFSPDGGRIATASADGTVRVWRSEPTEPRVLGRHGAAVFSVAVDADGRRVVSAAGDDTARVWNGAGAAPAVLRHYEDDGWVRSALFDPADATRIITLSRSGVVRIWNAADASTIRQWPTGSQSITAAISPDGRTLATASEESARLWALADTSHPIDLASGWIFDVSFSRDGSRVVTGAADGTAKTWDLAGAEQDDIDVHSAAAHAEGPGQHPDTSALPKATPRRIGGGHDVRVLSVSFGGDGSTLATASAESVARVWNIAGDVNERVLRIQHHAAVNDVSFSEDGTVLLTASSDKTVRLSDVATGGVILELPHPSGVRAAVFDRQTHHVVTGSEDGAVRLWRIDLADIIEYLKGATTACLAASDREAYLGESAGRAASRHAECERRAGR